MRILPYLLITLVMVGAGCSNAPVKTAAVTPEPSEYGELGASGNVLDLRRNELTKVPMGAFDRTDIDVLDISENRLTGSLPSQIGRLTQLKMLDVSDNQMTGVPAEIRLLKNLQVLDLSNNNLTGLPMELGDLTQLKVLDLRGNPYSTQDLDAIAAKLTNTEIRR